MTAALVRRARPEYDGFFPVPRYGPAGVVPLGEQDFAIGLPVLLGPLRSGWQYVGAFVRCTITPAVTVANVFGPSGAGIHIDGSRSLIEWRFGDLQTTPLRSAVLLPSLVIAAPEHACELDLVIRTDLSAVRHYSIRSRLTHGRPGDPWNCQLRLGGDDAKPARPSRNVEQHVRVGLGARLCLAVDIVDYSRFRNPEAARAQRHLLQVLQAARRYAGIAEGAIESDGAGDSQFAVLPPGLDEAVVVPRLIHGIGSALAELNGRLDESSRMRLRVAFDRGLVDRGVNGWVGDAVIAVHRLLDSPPLRSVLSGDTHADFAVAVSDTVFHDVVRHGYDGLSPTEFTATTVDLPAKGFHARAWIHVPQPPTKIT